MNKTIFLLIFAEFVFIFGSGLYGPIYAIFVERVGGDILDVGIAWAIFLISMATLELPFGKLIDKYGKKKFLAACYLLVSVSIFGYIFVTNKYQLFLLQLLTGTAVAMGDPAWDAWFSLAAPKRQMGFEWALYHMLTGYSQGIAALLGGALAYFIGFKFLFFVGGSIAVISFFITLTIKEEKGLSEKLFSIFHRHRGIKRRIRL